MGPAWDLLAAAIVSAGSVALMAWRTTRIDPSQPDRLISELNVARWAAILLAAVGAWTIGLGSAHATFASAGWDISAGGIVVAVAGLVLLRDPRDGLGLATLAFAGHALFTLAHRPDWLSPDTIPHTYVVGAAIYDVSLAGLCFWTRR
jgi:hypothetical protein